ncbi:wax ester synthase/diacylglycerol acyltransferase 8-like isoform X2 [Hevea brasiliensis]|uniref:wax ester synthase/diacylglycerol acyltransferase 8-like isoform X2 n=1 Tax=Hevea brasiliensis TaxID=3981 RepID=UPI0025EE8CEE|nr:wax ester synthase/diacylglycerol acyltransferase 8-like isoform X2 [Hevea brasiliensis]
MESLGPIRVSKKDSEDGQPLSPMARFFHQPYCDVYTITIMGFNTPINPLVFKASLRHSLLKHPRFSCLPVVEKGGEMRWVKTEVNLDNHVRVPVLDPNMESPDKFVEDYASNLSKTTITKSIPLWDVHLLNVKTSEAESTVIFRIHHSLGDGISLMSLLLSCSRKASDPEALPTIPTIKRRNPSNSGGLTSWQFLLKLWWLVLLCWNTIVDVLILLGTIFFLEDTKTPLKGTLPLGLAQRRFVHRTIILDDVKLVKNAMGTTINDVMVAITQAGLSSYLNRKYGDDKTYNKGAEENNNNLPNNIRLRAALAVNIRPSAGIQISSFPNRITLWFSNVPGPEEEISYFGHPVAFIALTVYGQPNALVIHVVSYASKMKITLSVDKNIIPDPYQLCDDLQNSLDLMKNAVITNQRTDPKLYTTG